MSETIPNSGAACSSFQRDLPLHALGARGGLESEDTARLEAHLAGCAACRELLATHRKVLLTVEQESSPSVLLDTDRVLRALQKRIEEGTRSGHEPVPGITPRGRILWFIALALFSITACILIAVFSVQERPRSTFLPPPTVNEKPLAVRYVPGQPAGEPLAAGVEVSANVSGVRIQYMQGVVIRPREGARMRLSAENELLLAEGDVAIYVPRSSPAFQVRAANGGAMATAQPGARFTVTLDSAGKTEVAVAQGNVALRGAGGAGVQVETGFGSSAIKGAAPSVPAPLDPQAAFAWLLEETYRSLKCEFQAGAAPGVKVLGTLSLLNTGDHPVRVANYHALGVNYFLEIRGPGERTPKSAKLSPRALRKVLADGGSETYTPSKSAVELNPGDRYILEMDLTAVLEGAGPFVLAGNYIGFETDPADPSGKGTWGFSLRSEEVTYTPAKPAAGK